MVTLVKCGTLAEADAIRARLEAAGITALLPDEALMQTVAWNLNTYGFVRLQVASRDYERAQELLASMRQETKESEEAKGEPSVDLAQLPLSSPMRWLAFVLPVLTCPGLLIFAVVKGGYTNQGCARKAREWGRWFAGGILFWVVAFVVFAASRELLR